MWYRYRCDDALHHDTAEKVLAIPGVSLRGRVVHVEANAAWLVEDILRAGEVKFEVDQPIEPEPIKSVHDLVPNGLQPWVPDFLTDYQREGVVALSNKNGYFIWAAGCLAGDTVIAPTGLTIRELYLRRHEGAFPLSANSVDDHAPKDTFRNLITDVVYSGRKELFEVTITRQARSKNPKIIRKIKATADHGFLVHGPAGPTWMRLGDIVPGAKVYITTDDGKTTTGLLRAPRSIGIDHTYDICMLAPFHNFVANGIVVHNSGKSLGSICWAMVHPRKTLVVTRAPVRRSFGREIERFTNKRAFVVEGTTPIDFTQLSEEFMFVVVSHQILPDHYKEIVRWRPHNLILDELHHLSSHKRWTGTVQQDGKTKFSQLDNIASAAMEISRVASRRLGLSATPVRNIVKNLWAQLDLIEPMAWGPYYKQDRASFAGRYCLPAGAPVWMVDLTHKPIEDIRKGDWVWGWDDRGGGKKRRMLEALVLDTFSREAEVIEATLASGKTVRSTRDHLWANAAKTKKTQYRVLSAGRTQDRPERRNCPKRPTVLGMIEDPEWPIGDTSCDDYKRGYLHGLVDGDGCISYRWHLRPKGVDRTRGELVRRVDMRLDRVNVEALDRFEAYATDLGLEPSRVAEGKMGTKYKRMLHVSINGQSGVDFFYQPREGGDDYWRGFLAGIFDAEGFGGVFAQYRIENPETYDNIADALQRFGFKIGLMPEAIKILGEGKQGTAVREFLRFWQLVQPAIKKKADPILDLNLYWKPDPVVSIRSLGIQTVYDIKTTTGNFVAYGYGSHNCDAHPGVYGGIDDKGAKNLDELWDRVSIISNQVSYATTHRGLPPKRRLVTFVPVADQVRATGFQKDFKAAVKAGGTAVLEMKLMEAAARKRKYIKEVVRDALEAGQKVVVFTGRRADCDTLGEEIGAIAKDTDAKIWVGHGGHSSAERDQMMKAYMAAPAPAILVGTGDAWGEGMNLQDTDLHLIAMLPYTPGQVIQWEGRCARLGQKRPVMIQYLIAEGTVDEHVADILIRKLPAVEDMVGDESVEGFAGQLAGADHEDEILDSIMGLMSSKDVGEDD